MFEKKRRLQITIVLLFLSSEKPKLRVRFECKNKTLKFGFDVIVIIAWVRSIEAIGPSKWNGCNALFNRFQYFRFFFILIKFSSFSVVAVAQVWAQYLMLERIRANFFVFHHLLILPVNNNNYNYIETTTATINRCKSYQNEEAAGWKTNIVIIKKTHESKLNLRLTVHSNQQSLFERGIIISCEKSLKFEEEWL